jgi:hypothetical protein
MSHYMDREVKGGWSRSSKRNSWSLLSYCKTWMSKRTHPLLQYYDHFIWFLWAISCLSLEPEYLSRYSDGLRTALSGFDSRKQQQNFLYSAASSPALIHTTSYAMGTAVPLLGVRQPGREGDHSPFSRARTRMTEQYLHSPIYLHDIVLN